MKTYYNDETLPCLQAIGPWWSEIDRRILFCHLMNIFGLEAKYIASLPAASYSNLGKSCHISSLEIENEFHAFLRENNNKKGSCPKIRNISFSFGKLNPRLCCLCPYSSTYKNQNQSDEYRFIYYLIHSKSVSLSTYINQDNMKTDNIFISHFPVYIDEILIDSYPFSLIAEKFLQMYAGDFIYDHDNSIKKILDLVHSNIDKRIKYLRIKDIIMEYYPDYQTTALLSADNTIRYLEESNCNTRYTVNESLIKRLFNRLKDHKPYVPLNPQNYLYEEVSILEPVLFESSVLANNNSTDIGTSEYLDKETDPSSNNTSQKECTGTTPTNPLSMFEDDYFRTLQVMDELIINRDIFSESSPIKGISDAETFELPSDEPHTSYKKHNNKSQDFASYTTFKEYYVPSNPENLFIYGSAGISNDTVIFNAFIENAAFLCMEPAICDSVSGVLIANPSEDMLFYSIGDYGPKLLRVIADTNIPVYTSNSYYLCRYLFQNKVFKLNIKDIGIAKSLMNKRIVRGIKDITLTPWQDCMNEYRMLYEDAVKRLSDDDKQHLKRLEKYSCLLCSNGEKAPFADIEHLYSVPYSSSFDYTYKAENKPNISGVFFFIKAITTSSLHADDIIKHYIDICIDLDEHISFTSGNIYILKLNENGILFYITGNDTRRQEIQLYLSAGSRRCFSSISSKDNSVIIEEKSQIYEIRKH